MEMGGKQRIWGRCYQWTSGSGSSPASHPGTAPSAAGPAAHRAPWQAGHPLQGRETPKGGGGGGERLTGSDPRSRIFPNPSPQNLLPFPTPVRTPTPFSHPTVARGGGMTPKPNAMRYNSPPPHRYLELNPYVGKTHPMGRGSPSDPRMEANAAPLRKLCYGIRALKGTERSSALPRSPLEVTPTPQPEGRRSRSAAPHLWGVGYGNPTDFKSTAGIRGWCRCVGCWGYP